jgi:hypothetical protein
MRLDVNYDRGFAYIDFNFEAKLVTFTTDNPGLARRLHNRLIKLDQVAFRFPLKQSEWTYQVPLAFVKNPVHLMRRVDE